MDSGIGTEFDSDVATLDEMPVETAIEKAEGEPASVQRSSSLEAVLQRKKKRRTLCLDEETTILLQEARQKLALNTRNTYEKSDVPSPEERKMKVMDLPEFSSVKPTEVDVGYRRRPIKEDRKSLELLELPNDKAGVRKDPRFVFEATGPCGEEKTDRQYNVLTTEQKWFCEFYDKNKDKIYPSFNRGSVLLINNINFVSKAKRDGSKMDVKRIQNLFSHLGYDVSDVFQDQSAMEIEELVIKFSKKQEHRKSDCTFVIIMSHGREGGIFGSDDQTVSINKLVTYMNSANAPLLAGKPKFFIIQACRGQSADPGISRYTSIKVPSSITVNHSLDGYSSLKITDVDMEITDSPLSQEEHERIVKFTDPVDADILIAHSCTKSRGAFLHIKKGSWFIRSICEVFSEFAKDHHIVDLLTMVNNRVARHENEVAEKQIPEFRSRLKLPFYFFPGVKPHNNS